MNLDSPKVTVQKSAQYIFDALSNVKNFEKLIFHPKVTYLIGENGMGKSTLLEAMAVTGFMNSLINGLNLLLLHIRLLCWLIQMLQFSR